MVQDGSSYSKLVDLLLKTSKLKGRDSGLKSGLGGGRLGLKVS